jgi:SNF2 family DNA or RNA helicase
MVCDEAQKIKNPSAMVTRAAKKQNVQFRIACTGTPVENTLTDLWCLFDFIQPGLLGSLSEFGKRYRRPIEAATDEERMRVDELREMISLQLLRRTKKEVAKDLPAKVETCHPLTISSMQLQHYRRVMTELKRESDGRKHLEMIQVLRRVISDPFAFNVAEAERTSVEEILEHNPKMRWLIDELRNIRSVDEKAIVFCEFRSLQRMIQRCIARLMDVHADIINGDTSSDAGNANSRQKRIRHFQDQPGFGVIILSPLAVGFGVNIQAANHVIHFSRTWNPAKEDQATDRAYRIGQTKDVHVHYPIIGSTDFTTFDEKLHELLTWKRGLSEDMLNGAGELKAEDFGSLSEV